MPPDENEPAPAQHSAAGAEGPVRWYASIDIVQDGQRITAGTQLPLDFPAQTLRTLIAQKYVAKSPPQPTVITRTPGK